MSAEISQLTKGYLEEVSDLLASLSYSERLTAGEMGAINRLEDKTAAILNNIEPSGLEDELRG